MVYGLHIFQITDGIEFLSTQESGLPGAWNKKIKKI